MRNILLVTAIFATACGARAATTTLPTEYACGDTILIRDHGQLAVRDRHMTGVTRTAAAIDDDRYLIQRDGGEALEVVMPADVREDATARVLDDSTGERREIGRRLCTAQGGYSDALARYLRGATLDQLSRELSLTDRRQARELVRHGMIALSRRYYRDR